MAADPIHQFQITKLVDFGQVNLPLIGRTDLAFTNSHLAMTIAFLVIVAFLTIVTSNMKVVPGRTQAVGEQLFSMIDNLGDSIIGHEGKALFPFVFTIFSFILAMNVLGLLLTFTVTSQLAITATFALITIGLVLIIGFARNGLGFFKLFVPSGVHWGMLFILAPIEFISFMVRPVTLSMRLFGNMIGGHVVMYMFASFVVAMAVFASQGGIATLGYVGSALSLFMVIALCALELIVAFLQAFVFAALTCTYLSDVVNLDHGH
jgi:F-type H+-transporting ATPase subunit a